MILCQRVKLDNLIMVVVEITMINVIVVILGTILGLNLGVILGVTSVVMMIVVKRNILIIVAIEKTNIKAELLIKPATLLYLYVILRIKIKLMFKSWLKKLCD